MVVSFSGGCSNVAARMTTTLWLVLLTNMPLTTVAMRGMKMEHFETELFLSDGDLNAGLYEGMVTGRRLFGSSQIPHGKGTIHYFTNDKFNRDNYTGQWVKGNREGFGTTYFRDGSMYTGEYLDSLENGVGMITYSNGDVIDANFVDGMIEGHGVLKYTNGDQREGFFNMNKLDGQVIYTKSNGRIVVEVWENGERLRDVEEVIFDSDEVFEEEGKESVEDDKGQDEGRFRLRELVKSGRGEKFGSNPEPPKPSETPRIQVVEDRSSQPMPVDRIMSLRVQTERRNTNFLRSIFEQVNSTTKRRKRRRLKF